MNYQCARGTGSDRRRHYCSDTRATPLFHCKAMAAMHAYAHRSGAHQHERSKTNIRKQWCARSHISHRETRCTNAHATIKIAIATLQHSAQVTALKPAAGMSAQNSPGTSLACSQSAHDTAATIFVLSQCWRIPHAHSTLLASHSSPPSAHAHARRHTRRDKPHPAPRLEHVHIMARVTQLLIDKLHM